MSRIPVSVTINGRLYRLEVGPGQRLLDVLRDSLDLTGTKEGCGIGECGACTVMLDGRPVNACLVAAGQIDGAEIVTVEGLADTGVGQVLQEKFIAEGAVQCGFCTPGMLISGYALLQRQPHPSPEEARRAISGNLCRCTGYQAVIQAILAAAEEL